MRSTVGIPLLPAQAVSEGQGGGGCQFRQDVFGQLRVQPHRRPFGLVQRAGFVQHAVAHAQFAHVVQQRAALEPAPPRRVNAHRPSAIKSV